MSREDLASLIVTDPDIVDEGIDISGLQTTTDTSPLLLANLEPGIQYDPTQQSVYSDLLSYFSGGLPMLPETPTASNINIPLPGGGGSGGGGTVSATTTAPITSTTIPTTAPFIETSPNVLSATDPVTGQPTSGNIVDPKTGDVFAPGDYSDVARTLADPKEKIDYTQDPEGFGNRVKTALLEGKDLVTEFGQGVADQITKIKDKGIDLGKLAGRAVANAVFPGLGFALDVIPERDPRQNKLDDLYDVKDGTIQSGLMAGYNPVSGGIPGISEPTFGLQDAYDKRINTINETLAKQGDSPSQELIDRRDALIEAKAKEADVLGITAAEDKRLGEAEMRQTIADAVRQKDLGVGPRAEEIKAAIGEDFGVEVGPDIIKKNISYPDELIPNMYDETDYTKFYTPNPKYAGATMYDSPDNFREQTAVGNLVDTNYDDEPYVEFEYPYTLKTINPFAPIEQREEPASELDFFKDDDDLLDDLGYGSFKDINTAIEDFPDYEMTNFEKTKAKSYEKTISKAKEGDLEYFKNYKNPEGAMKFFAGEEGQKVLKEIKSGQRYQNIPKETQEDYFQSIKQKELEDYKDPIMDIIEPNIEDIGVDIDIPTPTSTDPTLDIFDRGRGEIDVAPIDDEDDFEVSGDIAPGGMDQVLGKPVDTSIPDRGRGDSTPSAPAKTVSRTDTDYGQFGRRQEATAAGGGNQGGGSRKIVCTMMNESYGFGSFRNKIWLKHSKSLAPEYQKGYHKIFLPLVRLSKTNKLLKKTLEHIAVHRTIDIRQEARGKVHLLGRIYRKILEPICYVVGKYAKR